MPRQSALQAATSLMISAMPSAVQQQAQALLATLHPSKASYHSHKVIRQRFFVIFAEESCLREVEEHISCVTGPKNKQKQLNNKADLKMQYNKRTEWQREGL